jgi:hypothetical protein
MTELTIESVPSGAQVQIDGEIVGTTPLSFHIGEVAELEEFRAECVHGGSVTCSWDVLKTRLEDQTVSLLWWFLTEAERRSIAEQAIRNTLFHNYRYGRHGKANCEGGEGDVKSIVCVQNGVIRTLKFGKCSAGGDSCYYRRYTDSEEFCYVPNIQYRLPCNIVSCIDYEGEFCHSMCSIQVVNKIDSINNWIVFQYNDVDIKSGNWQMPSHKYDLYLKFSNINRISCGGYSSDIVTRFEHI